MIKILKDKTGLGTIEIVILLAILVGLALLFKEQITLLVTKILNSITEIDFEVERKKVETKVLIHVFY